MRRRSLTSIRTCSARGTYTGKGIYDVDAFEAALSGRVPDNALLSHDLFEGIFARTGLASDIEVVEEFPNRYNVAAKRQHRWVRGDWQLLTWIVGRGGAMPLLGRLRMLDNLRRSLLAPTTLMAVVFCWLLPMPAAIVGLLLVLATVAIPASLPSVFLVLPRRAGLRMRKPSRRACRKSPPRGCPDVAHGCFFARPGATGGRRHRQNPAATVRDSPSISIPTSACPTSASSAGSRRMP
jgi:hypothetical protein